MRTDRELQSQGTISHFDRDLSAVQLDAVGRVGGRSFRVVGVVRLARERVRWNEWALLFDDGTTGWLGESNGQYWIFSAPPTPVPRPRGLELNDRLELVGGTWVVVEAADATIVAAEGSLPYRVAPGVKRDYADLRRIGGGVGTLDLEDPREALLFAGESTTLFALQMEGLRPVTGWSDPALTNFRGAEIAAVRKLDCSCCGAPLRLLGGALTHRVVCDYCGGATDLGDGGQASEGEPLERRSQPEYSPQLPLGTRGKLDGIEWQIIGAMERSVRVEGVRYAWTEYFLHNPWRGSRWLVEANGHWSLVELLADLPLADERSATFRGVHFKAFQSGRARVDAVIGEFTWEVEKGEGSASRDYVADGQMLSREQGAGEVTWSHSKYLPQPTVEAFAKRQLPHPSGVAPHQPNPYAGRTLENGFLAMVLLVTGLGAGALSSVLAADERVAELTFPSLTTGEVAVGSFTMPDTLRRDSTLALTCTPTLEQGWVVTLINAETGSAYEQSFTGSRTQATEWRLDTGLTHVRLEAADAAVPAACSLVVTRDRGGSSAIWAGILATMAFVGVAIFARSSFESQRWQESSFS